MQRYLFFILTMTLPAILVSQKDEMMRTRDHGIVIGVMHPGANNAITDVNGVRVGNQTIIKGKDVRTGVTAILPHTGNLFQQKVPAAIYSANGFGKLAGSTQVDELGNIETPIVLTNTLSVPTASNAVISYSLENNPDIRSVNAVVGETNDGRLNDIRGRHVKEKHVLQAIEDAASGSVAEGNVGAGTGTICFGYKGGIGTASRKIPVDLGGYTVGVLTQTNFGGVLEIAGHPIGQKLGRYPFKNAIEKSDGSCMIVVATDAPLSARNLKRLARRAMLGLAKTGGISSNGSGDYVIAFSTFEGNRIPYQMQDSEMEIIDLHNDAMTPLFMACIEATEEAIINSLFAAKTMEGRDGKLVEALPVKEVLRMMGKE